ncbi:membrane protein [Mycobacterium phage SydNat]|uniref:Uncharacterized protein n=1 Tax=Mycobacterium phage Zolita TaxID=2593355 RepID=A0A514U2I1_9CAUD|nr:hypothetical protein KIP50_gp21 [Mycobacterium phage Zolita]QDK03153.1 hypothetical protein SEA_ZOLITA_70 [Mycobacterium phage Zolita]UVK64289.1 membrane protein [Mycobacterium phage SydNat]UVK64377.1 hypothetical protein SEA_GHOULBOY_71 [Mycobacterium phage Ghoulboy]
MTPPGYHAPADVVESFMTSWADGWLAADVATYLSCVEVETLAGLLEALGEARAAKVWIEEHAKSDDCGDQHCLCEECNEG